MSYVPLQLIALMEETVLAQTKYQYPFDKVYKQDCSIYSFIQNPLSNDKWYEQFNTNIDVGLDIGITRQQKVLLSHVFECFVIFLCNNRRY